MSKNTLYTEVKAALENRLAVIADHQARAENPDAHLAALRSASEQIQMLETKLSKDTDAKLRHFLTHASFDKALRWLNENLE